MQIDLGRFEWKKGEEVQRAREDGLRQVRRLRSLFWDAKSRPLLWAELG